MLKGLKKILTADDTTRGAGQSVRGDRLTRVCCGSHGINGIVWEGFATAAPVHCSRLTAHNSFLEREASSTYVNRNNTVA